MPVGPSSKIDVTNLEHLPYFSGAFFAIHAGPKFCEHEWNAESLGILRSRADAIIMKIETVLLRAFNRLSVFALIRHHLTAIGMIMKHVCF